MTAVCLQELTQVRRIVYSTEEAGEGPSAVGKTLIKLQHKTQYSMGEKKTKKNSSVANIGYSGNIHITCPMTNYISRREEERTVRICIYRESSLQAATASQTRFLGYAKTAHGPAVPCHTTGMPFTLAAAAADSGKCDTLAVSSSYGRHILS